MWSNKSFAKNIKSFWHVSVLSLPLHPETLLAMILASPFSFQKNTFPADVFGDWRLLQSLDIYCNVPAEFAEDQHSNKIFVYISVMRGNYKKYHVTLTSAFSKETCHHLQYTDWRIIFKNSIGTRYVFTSWWCLATANNSTNSCKETFHPLKYIGWYLPLSFNIVIGNEYWTIYGIGNLNNTTENEIFFIYHVK